jgi:hypothetical protein
MPIVDQYALYSSALTGPAERAEPVTPSDSVDLEFMSRAIYVGVAGDLRVTVKSGQTVTLVAAAVGWHPIRVSRVWATGTTATDIVAFS